MTYVFVGRLCWLDVNIAMESVSLIGVSEPIIIRTQFIIIIECNCRIYQTNYNLKSIEARSKRLISCSFFKTDNNHYMLF